MTEKRKHFAPEVNLKILKELQIDPVPMSELSECYGIPPSSIYQWQNQLFTNGAMIFQRKNDPRTKNSSFGAMRMK